MIKTFIYIALKSIIRKTGYRISKRSKFDDTLDFLLKSQNDFFFIQIGANDGVRFDTLYYKLTSYPISGIVVEPINKYYQRLKLNYEDYPNVIPLNLALHPSEKSIKLYYDETKIPTEPWRTGIGSIYESHLKKLNTSSENIRSIEVDASSLIEIINKYSVKKIDLLQIDTEGFDYEILKMIPFNQIKPRLIKYEYVHLAENYLIESLELLKNYGYKVYKEDGDIIAVLPET